MSTQDFAMEFWDYYAPVLSDLKRAHKLEFEMQPEDPPEAQNWKDVMSLRLRFGRIDPEAAPKQAERIAAEGGGPYSIAKALGIDAATLGTWCDAIPSLRWAIERGYAAFRDTQPPRKRPRCPRCGGWVEMVFERTKDAHMDNLIPRCLICGGRFYRGVPVIHGGKKKSKRFG